MSSKPTEPRSIASQLVFLFTPAAILLLGCGLGVLYWIVVRHGLAEDRAVLADKVLGIRADLRSAAGPSLVKQELKALQGERTSYWVRLLDEGGFLGLDGAFRFIPDGTSERTLEVREARAGAVQDIEG